MTDSINNYTIGKGIVSFQKTGASVYRDLGNSPRFEIQPNVETLAHFSSRTGVKTKDAEFITSKSATLTIDLEEIDPDNVALSLLGQKSINASGFTMIDILKESKISGKIKLVMSNDIGRNYEIILPNVDFKPGEAIGFISEELMKLTITGEVTQVAGSFGTIRDLESSSGSSGL